MIPFPYGRQRPFEHERVAARGRDQLGGEARLPDARLAHDRDDAARAVGDRPLELRQQRASSASRPTRGESILRATPAASGSTSSSRQASTGSDFPFSASAGTGSTVTASRTRRIVASPTRISPAVGGRLEPLRDVDGVAGGERIALGRVACIDLARVDAGPHTDPDPERRLELVVQARELAAELDRGPDCAQRVVLVHDRDPEDAEDGVADELLDRAAVALEHRPRRLVIARPDTPERLRIKLLTKRRRVLDVAEDERHRLPDHERESRAVSRPFLGRSEEQKLRGRGRGEVKPSD